MSRKRHLAIPGMCAWQQVKIFETGPLFQLENERAGRQVGHFVHSGQREGIFYRKQASKFVKKAHFFAVTEHIKAAL